MTGVNCLAVPISLTKSVKFGRELVVSTFEGGWGCEAVGYAFHAWRELFGRPNIPYGKRSISGVNWSCPPVRAAGGVKATFTGALTWLS